jgi:hypothetical protein
MRLGSGDNASSAKVTGFEKKTSTSYKFIPAKSNWYTVEVLFTTFLVYSRKLYSHYACNATMSQAIADAEHILYLGDMYGIAVCSSAACNRNRFVGQAIVHHTWSYLAILTQNSAHCCLSLPISSPFRPFYGAWPMVPPKMLFGNYLRAPGCTVPHALIRVNIEDALSHTNTVQCHFISRCT